VNRLLVWYGELSTSRKLTARGLSLMALPLVWISLLLVAPLAAMVAWSAATRGPAGDIVWTLTLENFRRLAGFDAFGWTKAYLAILGSTVVMSAVTTAIAVSSATMSAASCFATSGVRPSSVSIAAT